MTIRKRRSDQRRPMTFDEKNKAPGAEDIQYELTEVAALEIMRRIFVGHAEDCSDGFTTATTVSEWYFGREFGRSLALALND